MGKAYEVVRTFEEEIASWANAPYAVAVESCTMAIFLCLKYLQPDVVSIPKYTYPGVAMSVRNAGCKLVLDNRDWQGMYLLEGTKILDSALRFRKNMYVSGHFHCLSFHYKKLLPIGRGGMILLDDCRAYQWLKMARFDGRKEIPLCEDNATILGWNAYMTPEQASRGLCLFESMKNKNLPDLKMEEQGYPDLTTWEVFK